MTSKAERRYAMDQAIANTRIEGHRPTPEFLVDVEMVVDGRMTYEQAVAASAARAAGNGNLGAGFTGPLLS
jgi:hypothetical protein